MGVRACVCMCVCARKSACVRACGRVGCAHTLCMNAKRKPIKKTDDDAEERPGDGKDNRVLTTNQKKK